VLADAPPLPGEEARYAQVLAVLAAAKEADEPSDPGARANWLPALKGGDFSLYVRAYWPKPPVMDGSWTPPPVEKAK
jgi:hypothetical protein